MSDHPEHPPVHIRRATRDDVEPIIRMLSEDLLGSKRERYLSPLPQVYYDAFDEIDRTPSNELVVVEADGEIIGTLQITFIPYLSHQGGKRALIESVHVDARYRSKGVGAKLFEWAIARAREQRCRMVQLTTDKQRPDALRFYERLGFVPSHTGMKLHLTARPGA